jgi:hypothetical protein
MLTTDVRSQTEDEFNIGGNFGQFEVSERKRAPAQTSSRPARKNLKRTQQDKSGLLEITKKVRI